MTQTLEQHHTLNLNGFTFDELFHAEGLQHLDTAFLTFLKQEAPSLHAALLTYRSDINAIPALQLSELLIGVSRVLEHFLANLFNIEDAVAVSTARTTAYNPIAVFKKYFVLKRAKKEVSKAAHMPSFTELTEWLQTALDAAPVKPKTRN